MSHQFTLCDERCQVGDALIVIEGLEHALAAALAEKAALLVENTSLSVELKTTQENLDVAHQIGDSFWDAIKPLKLDAINVENPGAHVTEIIDELKAAGEIIIRLIWRSNQAAFQGTCREYSCIGCGVGGFQCREGIVVFGEHKQDCWVRSMLERSHLKRLMEEV